MIILKSFLLLILVLPAMANDPDDEIIKNLDFFQSMELIKEDTPVSYDNPGELSEIDDVDLENKQ